MAFAKRSSHPATMLGYGPIDGDPSLRREWFDETLGEHYGECVDSAEAACEGSSCAGRVPYLLGLPIGRRRPRWISGISFTHRRTALRSNRRVGAMIEGRTRSWRLPTLGIVTEDQLLATGVLQRRTTPNAEEVAESRETWRRLASSRERPPPHHGNRRSAVQPFSATSTPTYSKRRCRHGSATFGSSETPSGRFASTDEASTTVSSGRRIARRPNDLPFGGQSYGAFLGEATALPQ